MYARITIFRGYNNEWTNGIEITENNGKSWTTVAVTTLKECNKIMKELETEGYLKWDGVPW